MMANVILLKEKQYTVERGHPWIFPKAIAKTSGLLKTGDLVNVVTEEGKRIAIGAYNEHSLYRVRVLALAPELETCYSYHSLIHHRLHLARLIRQNLNLPNENTTAYRLFNSEADGLSGLTIDRFNDISVVSSSAYWVQLNKPIITEVLEELFVQGPILWITQNKALEQDGWLEVVSKPIDLETEVLEAGIKYQVVFGHAQKTGLFLDQRENHQRIASLAKNKKVLDLYTYTGGFALHAAIAGAREVLAVDSSKEAIEQAEQNARINQLQSIQFIKADARDYLKEVGDYDIIILDPPKLVPSKKHIEKAKNYYRFLHQEVFKRMKMGSLLMTCNCSSALRAEDFSSLVSAQATAVGKQARILGIYGPASCHPSLASFPEGNYLCAILVALV